MREPNDIFRYVGGAEWGEAEDAPQGATSGELTATCVVAPTAATGMQVLQTATAVRQVSHRS